MSEEMKKVRPMKKTLFMILITAILITACSTPEPTLPAPADLNIPFQPTTKATKPISTEFTPSDPKSVKLSAGKPQLVEFFAFW